MHYDVIRPKGSMGVVVMLKSNIVVGETVKVQDLEFYFYYNLSESSNKSHEPFSLLRLKAFELYVAELILIVMIIEF